MSETFFGLSPTAWIALLTVAITLIAIVQVCVYAIQARYMRGELAETRKAANTADQTMRIAHRACLNVIAIKFVDFGPEQSVSLTLTVTNSGHLPAKLQATSVALWTGIDDPFPEVESSGIPVHENWGVQHGLIPPVASKVETISVTVNFHQPVVFHKSEWDLLQRGEFPVRLFGAIRYSDGFESGSVGETGFAYEYKWNLSKEDVATRFMMANVAGYHYVRYSPKEGQSEDQP